MACVDFRVSQQDAVNEIAQWMDQQDQKYQIVMAQFWTIDEFVRARWVPLLYSADEAPDEERTSKFLNRYSVILCDRCGWYDETVVPSPYRINNFVLNRKEDMFRAANGLLIASKRLTHLIIDLIPEEIEWGNTTFASTKTHGVNPEQMKEFFWIRPKNVIGKSMNETLGPPCAKCGIPLACGDYPNGSRKIVPISPLVEHFGDKKWNIACLGTWTGRRDSHSEASMARQIVISGGLFAYIYNCGIKGFVFPEQIVFSASGEPPIEEDRRFADLNTGKQDKILRKRI
jgi:hypothetical protein